VRRGSGNSGSGVIVRVKVFLQNIFKCETSRGYIQVSWRDVVLF
jgi:hypothetical protein